MERLLYISQGKDSQAHIDNIQLMLDSGCRWIQLRMKNVTAETLLPTAETAKKLCDQFGAALSINDHPEVARDVEAWGVHLGLHDMPVNEAREIVGSQIKIGGTVNTVDDIKQRVKEGVDYVGLGPLHYTKTKEHLSPLLGHRGVRTVMDFVKAQGYDLPIFVVGGVTKSDIKSLIESGVFGVGISTILTESHFPEELVIELKKDIDEAVKNS